MAKEALIELRGVVSELSERCFRVGLENDHAMSRTHPDV
jgi:hypothetical protein